MENKNRLKLYSAVVVVSFLYLSSPLKGVSETNPGSGTAEYVIEDIQGPNVQVLEEGKTQWESAVEGQVVDSGDEVKVGEGSETTLMMESETSVHLSEKSDMKIEKITANETGGFLSRLQVFAGNLLADVKKNLQDSHSTFEVESNGVICGVRGTAFEVSARDGESEVATHEGKVEVGNGTESHMVTAGNISSFSRGKFQTLRRLETSEIQRFQKWRTFRQMVRQKRLQRIADIQNHRRQAWQRRHAHFDKDKRSFDKKNERKKPRKKFRNLDH